MAEKRKYELKQRADGVAHTRWRITEATVELHRTVGPAATRVTDIARRAGVQRVTVYKHFPDETSLLSACSTHWRSLHPSPDAARWRAVRDPGGRLRVGLGELYGWYRETEAMTANVLRDSETIPTLRSLINRGLGSYLEEIHRILCEPFHARGRRRNQIAAATRAAIDFHLWRILSVLGDGEAAELAAGLVEQAACLRPSAPPGASLRRDGAGSEPGPSRGGDRCS